MKGTPLGDVGRIFGLTRYGSREWSCALLAGVAIGSACAIVAAGAAHAVAWWLAAALALLGGVAGALFFRDPVRCAPEGRDGILSPADGVVRDIEVVSAPEGISSAGSNMHRIGIFLSIFDVHLNRAPCEWHVLARIYTEGAYHDARHPLAGQENESLLLAGEARAGGRSFAMAVRQVSGAIARRIVCAADVGAALARGQRYGMIKFGSRTELYLPVDEAFEICVAVGERVRAGESIIARVSAPREEGS